MTLLVVTRDEMLAAAAAAAALPGSPGAGARAADEGACRAALARARELNAQRRCADSRAPRPRPALSAAAPPAAASAVGVLGVQIDGFPVPPSRALRHP